MKEWNVSKTVVTSSVSHISTTPISFTWSCLSCCVKTKSPCSVAEACRWLSAAQWCWTHSNGWFDVWLFSNLGTDHTHQIMTNRGIRLQITCQTCLRMSRTATPINSCFENRFGTRWKDVTVCDEFPESCKIKQLRLHLSETHTHTHLFSVACGTNSMTECILLHLYKSPMTCLSFIIP